MEGFLSYLIQMFILKEENLVFIHKVSDQSQGVSFLSITLLCMEEDTHSPQCKMLFSNKLIQIFVLAIDV